MNDWSYPYIMIASRNKGKVKQFSLLFQELGLKVKSLLDFPDIVDTEEDQETFVGNAIKKAEAVADFLQMPVIADDSGLEVDALDGRPGVHSARYAGIDASDQERNEKLLFELQGVPQNDRMARFVCVLAIAIPGKETATVSGECAGKIIDTPRGESGFGYDPLFLLPQLDKTMAELIAADKFALSHRGEATRKMIKLLKSKYNFVGAVQH